MFSRKRYSIKQKAFLAIFLCTLSVCIWFGDVAWFANNHQFTTMVNAQSTNSAQLIDKGLQLYQSRDINGAIAQWEKAVSMLQRENNPALAAIARENLARAYQETRQGEQSIKNWNQVIAYYRQVENQEKIGRSLVELAQVYSSLGQTKEALVLLCNPDKDDNCSLGSAVEIAKSSQNKLIQAASLGSLGDVNRLRGDYEESLQNLEASRKIVEQVKNPGLQISVLNSLGNTYISLGKDSDRQAESATVRGDTQEAEKLKKQAQQYQTQAGEYLQRGLQIARQQSDTSSQIRALLRIIPLDWRDGNKNQAEVSLKEAIDILEKLPDSRDRVYATIDVVNLMHLLQASPDKPAISRWDCVPSNSYPQEIALLETAIKVAEKIKDDRAESFALGALGHIYECRQDYSQAIKITNKARIAAEQKLKAQDSLYLWEWQTGRIFKAQGNISEAISAYERAVNTLDTIRQDILTANRDIQFDFRDTIEPIYRELVMLRLDLEASLQASNKSLVSANKSKDNSSNNISQMLKTVDSLKLAELQNYFGNDCIITPFQQKTIQEIGDSQTAFLNTIILKEKTVVVLTLPNGENKLKTINISQDEIESKINQFRIELETVRYAQDPFNTELAQELYSWLVKPFIQDITNSQIKTLVFIQDGILRSVPMAALHDGKEFLIQKFAVATIPSINLTDIRPIQKNNLRMLALGLTQPAKFENKNFPELTSVEDEINQILQTIPGKQLINEEFTNSRLETELRQNDYSILHIATHGEFGTQTSDTFIVTGEKNLETGDNQILNFDELETKIRSVTRSQQILELLTLTACKTAKGDERSTLGLAGVAIQAGAKSAIASLWAIQDAPTAEIAANFYRLLKDKNITKAEALQIAQKQIIEQPEHSHPAYWSPLILIGNWQ